MQRNILCNVVVVTSSNSLVSVFMTSKGLRILPYSPMSKADTHTRTVADAAVTKTAIDGCEQEDVVTSVDEY